MKSKPKFKVGDVVKDVGYEVLLEDEDPARRVFTVGAVYWNSAIKRGTELKWCYLPKGEKARYRRDGDEEKGAAPANSYWEGHLDLVKRKITLEENE